MLASKVWHGNTFTKARSLTKCYYSLFWYFLVLVLISWATLISICVRTYFRFSQISQQKLYHIDRLFYAFLEGWLVADFSLWKGRGLNDLYVKYCLCKVLLQTKVFSMNIAPCVLLKDIFQCALLGQRSCRLCQMTLWQVMSFWERKTSNVHKVFLFFTPVGNF